MKTVNAKTPVKSGYYFSVKNWTVQPIAKDGELLEGEAGEQFIPLSLPLAIAAAPILGAGFLFFMPVLGFYMAGVAVTRPLTAVFRKTTTELAATMSPGLVPGEAYLTGKRTDEAKKEEVAAAEGELAELSAEIEAKRAPKA